MRHCPKCHTLFSDHSLECPDCGVEAADGWPPPMQDDEPGCEPKVVFSGGDFLTADRLVGALEENGIRAVVHESAIARCVPAAWASPYTVYVRAREAERARELIDEFLASGPGEPPAEE